MRDAGAARVIPLVAAGAVAVATALILAVAADAPSGAREHRTREEARAAAALYELPGVAEADVVALLDGRARIVAPEAGGRGPGAHAYRAGALDPAAWIAVEPRGEGRRWPWAASLLALLGVLCMAAWAGARRLSPPPPPFTTAPARLCGAGLAQVAGAAPPRAGRGR
ncbi:MAG: hypothetical protein F4228_03095, partial [Acidobacteria bacterium]|nr:hypothetical protein [Acidobacteriota bacterium]